MIKSVLPLSLIIALRFLGLFLVLPVISVYALNLQGATPTLVGIVVGGYALTQMIFQVPFGIMSDKLGRKGTIVTGLIIFAIGSLICALSTDIYTLMLGRLLQGAGAIGAVVTATISDLVKEEQRPKAMAMMGMFIGISFAVSMLAGPLVGAYLGVESLFVITMVLALASIFIILKKVPNPPKITHTYNAKPDFGQVLGNTNLIKMNITNFLQKGLMTFAFMIIPITLTKAYEWDMTELWKVYLPAMILGFLAMAPAAILAEKKGKFKEILIIGIALFAISYLIIGFSTGSTAFIIGVAIFFIGFNMHEPIMQSLATKFAKVHQRGLVLGFFNSFGYLGTFLGGLIGGAFYQDVSMSTLVITIAIICILWAILIFTMPNPAKKKFVYLSLEEYHLENSVNLSSNEAIDEWYLNNTENVIAIKYDGDKISEDEIKSLLK
ncbi:MFS transporter [Malaciobacter pacificus]|jgi:MFS family permease|uniref:Putative sugar transporter, major facilitator superfamily n=1 Tax=Malaciobacter pacificus TaxID=1080223 RepID=A0A5C2H438_9BACT|nr:MFS transporter [Malaciobacter pacificus]QEP33757.1 putative sugar transporter, major facilitator superfamily [Malaciobacter pacificus]GGD33065.1 MFS transporter [Malaciobacter pacificus]